MRARALLGPHLDDALVSTCGAQHPLTFAHSPGQRLLDVDVLAGGAGQDRHERMPVIRRRHDDRVDVLAVEHAPEVGEGGRVVAGHRDALRHPLVGKL